MDQPASPQLLAYATPATTSGAGGPPAHWFKRLLRNTPRVLMGPVALVAVTIAAGIIGGPGFMLFSLFMLTFLVYIAAKIQTHLQSRHLGTILCYFAQCTRLNLPLPKLIAAAIKTEHGHVALLLSRTWHALNAGYPVSTALAVAATDAPPRMIALISSAELANRLPNMLSRLSQEYSVEIRRQSTSSGFYKFYPLMMSVLFPGIVAAILVFIVPKFRDITYDFKTIPPFTTQWLIRASDSFKFDFFGLGFQPLILFIFLPFLALIAWFSNIFNTAFQLGSPLPFGPLHIADRLRWWLPLTHAIERDSGLADVFQILHFSLAAGNPIEPALREAATLPINPNLRRKITRWSHLTDSGTPFAQAAKQAGLPPLATGLLSTANSNLPDTLDFLARYYHSRFSRTATLLQSAAVPLTVLFFALITTFIVLALFQPLVSLIKIASQDPRWF